MKKPGQQINARAIDNHQPARNIDLGQPVDNVVHQPVVAARRRANNQHAT